MRVCIIHKSNTGGSSRASGRTMHSSTAVSLLRTDCSDKTKNKETCVAILETVTLPFCVLLLQLKLN